MGGSASKNFGLPGFLDGAIGVATLGSSKLIENVAKTGASMANKPGDAAAAQGKALADQQSAASAAATALAQQPQTIQPDNFLSSKAGQLAGLRMGLAASTSGGIPGVIPAPFLSSPTLKSNAAGKSRLGS